MKAIITGHNMKLLEKESSQQSKPCNCKNKDIWPLKELADSNLSFIKRTYLMEIQQKAMVAAKQNSNHDIIIIYNHLKI